VTLRPGCRLVVAPAFHLPVDWAGRLLLGAGVEREGDGFFPRPGWRAPDDGELALLVADRSLALTRENLRDCLCLFRLPRHLQSSWWRLLEAAEAAGKAHLDGFDAFVVAVAEFLAFTQLAVPEGATFDLLVGKPGRRSLQRQGQPPGLTFNLAAATPLPMPDEAGPSRPWGGINLGEEATSLLFINLPARDLLAELRRCRPDAASPGTLGELAEQFFTLCPGYPPVRVRIEPGEGFRLPAGGLLVDGCTLDKQNPDVLLLVHHQGPIDHCKR
jgi:hypothetical protein